MTISEPSFVRGGKKGRVGPERLTRTQLRRNIGASGKPSHASDRLKNKMNKKKTLSQPLMMQAQLSLVHQELVGVDCSLQVALKKRATATTIRKWDPLEDEQEMRSRLRSWIAPDNGSTLSLLLNPESVEDTQTSSKTLALATNAGVTHSNQEAAAPGFGKVCFDHVTVANVFELSDLKKKR